MNEIALHRGSSPHLNTIDIFVDGQHLTEAVVSVPRYMRQVISSHSTSVSLMASSFRLQPDQRPTPCLLVVPLFTLH